MTAPSRRRDPLALRHTLGQRLWLARAEHPRSVAVLTWAALLSALALLVEVAT